MARTGLHPSEVKKARDALIAQGKRPSVDAVRVALGNTGSKTTIHKYLKELDELEGDGPRITITDALHDLVERLAAQLHDEADARIAAAEARSAEKARLHADALASLNNDLAVLLARLDATTDAAQAEQAAHVRTRAALQDEIIGRRTAEQQVADLRERLVENDTHRLSLEEKQKHSREALEHYRQSVKEQRDQDQRRHEQQIQQLQVEMRQLQESLIVKQDGITRLNQEGVRLVADLSHSQKALYDEQSLCRKLGQQVKQLQDVENRSALLEAQLGAKNAEAQVLHEQLRVASMRIENLAGQVRSLELKLATAMARYESQQSLSTELRSFIDQNSRPADGRQ
jgi:hypothetical protein